jgi:hypothetical protein
MAERSGNYVTVSDFARRTGRGRSWVIRSILTGRISGYLDEAFGVWMVNADELSGVPSPASTNAPLEADRLDLALHVSY